MKFIKGSITSTMSSKEVESGTRWVHSGKKKTKSTDAVLGGVGAINVNCCLRVGIASVPVALNRARGCVKLGLRSLRINVASYKGAMECFKIINIKSANSG